MTAATETYDAVVEPLVTYGRGLLSGEQLLTVRTLAMDAEEANLKLIHAMEQRICGETDDPVSMAYVGELAVHAIRLREIADDLVRDANRISGRLYDLRELSDDHAEMAS